MPTTTSTSPIAAAVATLSPERAAFAVEAVNRYGETSGVAPDYEQMIADEITDWGAGRLGTLSIAAAGAIRTELAR